MRWLKQQHKAILVIRLFLVAVFLMYGSVKLAGGQYYYGDWTMSKADRPNEGLVWAFYGYSPFYGRVTGLFELLPAIMLLFGRTSLIGAGALFAVGLNITVMDFAFDFPAVKYFALFYTVLSLVLVLHEKEKLSVLLSPPADVNRRATSPSARAGA
ncbi:hypothetical protein [Cryptosporangium sp. NPDC048952]|uniref:hypothetical protein n=1 Tax=Cryptosporangium sp. NPDC048952 TaxID=3363961 RepID=UPI003724B74A